jgi:hypothetical protein
MKSYATKATTPQRMTRKRLRREVFVFNKKEARLRRKENRLKRKSLLVENENPEQGE